MSEHPNPDRDAIQAFQKKQAELEKALVDQTIADLPSELAKTRTPEEWNLFQLEVRNNLITTFQRSYAPTEIGDLIALVYRHPDQTEAGNPDLDSDQLFKKRLLVELVSHLISNNTEFDEENRVKELDQLQALDQNHLFSAAFLLQKKYYHLSKMAYKTVEGIAFEQENEKTVWLADEISFPRAITLEIEDGKIVLPPGKKMLFGHFKGGGFVTHINNEEARKMEPIISLVLHAALTDFVAIVDELKNSPERYSGGVIVGLTPNPNLVELCKKQLAFKQVINIRKLVRDSIFNLNILKAMKLGIFQKMIANRLILTLGKKPKSTESPEDKPNKGPFTIVVPIDELIRKETELFRIFKTIDHRVTRHHPELAEMLHARPKVKHALELAHK
jgi:hypothetical protein